MRFVLHRVWSCQDFTLSEKSLNPSTLQSLETEWAYCRGDSVRLGMIKAQLLSSVQCRFLLHLSEWVMVELHLSTCECKWVFVSMMFMHIDVYLGGLVCQWLCVYKCMHSCICMHTVCAATCKHLCPCGCLTIFVEWSGVIVTSESSCCWKTTRGDWY